jgi:hypothetical protein
MAEYFLKTKYFPNSLIAGLTRNPLVNSILAGNAETNSA